MSVNLVDVNPDQLFKALRGALAVEIEDDKKRDLLLRHVGELKSAHGTGGFINAYISFMLLLPTMSR